MTGAAQAALHRVVDRYGRSALADPVALRSALRRLGEDLPAAEIAVLVAVAGAGVADELSGAGRRRLSGPAAVDAVVTAVLARTALPEAEVRTACAAFADVLGPAGDPPGGDPVGPADRERGVPQPRTAPRIAWDAAPVPEAATVPEPGRTGRRRWWIGAAAALVVAAVLVVGSLTWQRADPRPVAVDAYAVDQVAQRYRALGADVVRGALRCAPVTPDPGETERVHCDFGVWSAELVGYDSVGRLRVRRDAGLAAAADSARRATAVEGGSAFAMEQTLAGRSRVYWDAESPRPVSAAVSTARPLAELLEFYDGRRFAALSRPDQPGPAFVSPALWDLANTVVTSGKADCAATAPDRWFAEVAEQVDCTFPNGARAYFALVPDIRTLTLYRVSSAAPEYTVPGSVRLGSWIDLDDTGDEQAQLAEYVLAADGDSYLYYDRREELSFGLLWHPELTQDQLKEFFVSRGLEQ